MMAAQQKGAKAMPANMMITDGTPNFAARGEQAWWGSGESLDGDDGLATTAVRKARLDYGVFTEPTYFEWQGKKYATNDVAIFRPDSQVGVVQLGRAGKDYMPITNYRVAQLIDPLCEMWPANTAGGLGKGEDCFITLDAGTAEIAGDEMRQYFFAWNKHDGSGALRFMFTPVRVVCQNTCLLGAEQANVTTSVIHTRNVDAAAKFAIDLTVRLQKAQQDAMADLALFPKVKVDAAMVKSLLDEVYPVREYRDDPSLGIGLHNRSVAEGDETGQLSEETLASLYRIKIKREQALVKTIEMRQAAVLELKKLLDERPMYAWTAWLFYQAITAQSSHGGKGSDSLKGLSIMTGGDRAKPIVAAYSAITALPQFQDLVAAR